MGTIETAVLGEALQQAIGHRTVQQLVLCTHDLEPEFFEGEILQTFIGNDLLHNRRTRQLQLDYEIRQRGVGIDVYYDGQALAVHEGTARLTWNRIRMTGKRGGVFHPKLVLALCTDQDGVESLVVCTASANLTRGGWWTNVECADVTRIEHGERHGYLAGLITVVDLLWKASSPTSQEATRAVRAFLAAQQPFQNRTHNGVVRPTMLPPYVEFGEALKTLLGARVDGTHLEVIAPFHDMVPSATDSALQGLLEWFAPSTTTVLLPTRDGATTLSRETYDDLEHMVGVSWGALPSSYVRTSAGVDAVDRGLHAKVYRFWRGGSDPLEIVVVGSHNLTGPAHRGDTNAEVSVVHQVVPPRGRSLLERRLEPPVGFDALDPDGEAADRPTALPMTVCFDWAAADGVAATAKWDSGSKPPGVTLVRAGREVCRIVFDGSRLTPLDAAAASALREELMSSCVMTACTDEGVEAPLLVVELNHAHKPDLLSGAELTTAEILALWSLPDLRDRLSAVGRTRADIAADESDLDSTPQVAPPASMFDQFAGVYHAFAELRRRVKSAVADKDLRRAADAVYGATFDTPGAVLDLAVADADRDPVLAYVIHRCAELLDDHVARNFPAVVARCPEPRARLRARFTEIPGLRERMVAAVPVTEQGELREFVTWFDEEFALEETS